MIHEAARAEFPEDSASGLRAFLLEQFERSQQAEGGPVSKTKRSGLDDDKPCDGKPIDGKPVKDMRLLHFYGQCQWHDEVWVVGNRAALTALRDAIDTALSADTGAETQAIANASVADGEGFEVVVRMEDGPWNGEFWKGAAMPYSDEVAAAGNEREGVIWPFQRDPRYHEKFKSGKLKPLKGMEPR
jgi:hypothetical protein